MSEESEGSRDKPTARLEWVPLVSVPEQIEATLAAGFLQSEGVACNIESHFFSQEPTNLSLLGNFVLFVHEDAVERAKRLLEDRLELSVDPQEEKSLGTLLREERAAPNGANHEESVYKEPCSREREEE